MYITILFIFLLGACVGSFLNVCIYRLPARESIVFPSSHCFSCGKKLGLIDLVPIFNYIYLRGKCRHCGASFSIQYPLIELITALIFVLVWLQFGFTWETFAGWVLVSILIAITVTDIQHQIIPNKYIIVGLILGLPLVALQSLKTLQWGLIAFLVAGFFMLAIALVSRGGMGGGDIKLAALMGLYLGKAVVVALFCSFLVGGLVGIFLLLTGKKGRKDAVPFGPYLALGGIAALFYGNQIINWYAGYWF